MQKRNKSIEPQLPQLKIEIILQIFMTKNHNFLCASKSFNSIKRFFLISIGMQYGTFLDFILIYLKVNKILKWTLWSKYVAIGSN